MKKSRESPLKKGRSDTFLFVLFVILWLLILNILIFNMLAERRAASPLTTSLPAGITGRVSASLGAPLPQETFVPLVFFNVAIALSFTLNHFALVKKKHMAKRKGQSAFEFLSSYGWALAAGVLTLGALGYFGVLNLGILVPESCTLIPGLSCDDFTVVYDEATGHYTVSMIIRNGFGEDLVDVSVASLIEGMTCSAIGISGEETTVIPSGQTASFSLDCVASEEGAPLGGGAVVNFGGMAVQKVNRLQAQLQITYRLRSKQLPHTVLGKLTSKPKRGGGGGKGGSQDENETNMTHLECQNQMCVTVNGTGTNQCRSSVDCQVNATHTECSNFACIVVNGTGVNQCGTNMDCNITNMTHLECQNQMCIAVNGTGIDQCTSNTNCQNQTNMTNEVNATTLKGRLVNKYSRNPLANVLISHINNKDGWKVLETAYTNSNGGFEFKDTTYEMGYILYFAPDCYHQAGIVGQKNPTTLTYEFYLYDTSEYCNEKMHSILNNVVDLGEVGLQPAADIELTLDVPNSFNVYQKSKYCSYDIGGAGNTNQKLTHYLRNVVLLNYENRIVLGEGTGNVVKSGFHEVPYKEGCYKIQVNYKSGEFMWSDLIQK